MAVPLLKKAGKAVGKQAAPSGLNALMGVTQDMLAGGQNFKTSAKSRLREAGMDMANTAINSVKRKASDVWQTSNNKPRKNKPRRIPPQKGKPRGMIGLSRPPNKKKQSKTKPKAKPKKTANKKKPSNRRDIFGFY